MSEVVSQIGRASSILEKAVDIYYLLLLSSFVLLFDSALGIFYNVNILKIDGEWSTYEPAIGSSLLFLVAYIFTLSFVFPCIRQILKLLVTMADSNLHFQHISQGKDYDWPESVMKKAIIEKDKFLVDLVDRHNKERAELDKKLVLGLGVVMLIAVNYFLVGSYQNQSITQEIENYIIKMEPSFIKYLFKLIVFLYFVVIAVLSALSLRPDTYDKMYVPIKSDINERLKPEVPWHNVGPLDDEQ